MPVLFYRKQKERDWKKREKEMKKQYLVGFGFAVLALILVLTMCTVLYAKAGKNKEDDENLYGHIIAELGDASYQYIEDGETKTISKKEYLDVMEDYGKGTVVNFGYGSSDNPY